MEKSGILLAHFGTILMLEMRKDEVTPQIHMLRKNFFVHFCEMTSIFQETF